ncbi:hypothetical protein [Leisingera daeponensis]|uniref:hypothetical protein n=1 Tax=Leisingera daeponensis TaxID=405746 RepID=UPI001C979437|nr:hypothetical protein [Leisingera daeponensis]MBY6056777.1 hypothetical protein [Leisingera daeponensis]
MKLFGLAEWNGFLTDQEVKQWCGRFMHQASFVLPDKEVEPRRMEEIGLMQVPNVPVVKMSKSEYVDAFFEKGTIQLGTYRYFREFGHNEIGDSTEGHVVLFADGFGRSAIGRFEDDDRDYVFCSYIGQPDPDVISKFGYDSHFVIDDVEGFALAVQRKLSAPSICFGRCVYSPHKAMRSFLPEGTSFRRIDKNIIQNFGVARHFIKPDEFSHQREFRILWNLPEGVAQTPLKIDCPEAVQFCSR